jgi:hypothetical protein
VIEMCENKEKILLDVLKSIDESLKIIASKPPAVIQLCPGCENLEVTKGDDCR